MLALKHSKSSLKLINCFVSASLFDFIPKLAGHIIFDIFCSYPYNLNALTLNDKTAYV